MSSDASKVDVVSAETLGQALSHLAEGRRPIAGGTDLMVLFDAGKLPYRQLVSIQKLNELRGIETTGSHVSMGAGVTYTEIRNHPVLQREFELLCRAASWIGGIANQNKGTLGGNIANASPAADGCPMLLAYDAELELESLRCTRRIKYADFHTGYKTMRMEPDELITKIVLPRPDGPRIEYARKVGARQAQAISKLSMAGTASMDDGRVTSIRIAMASMAPVPLRCYATEKALLAELFSKQVRRNALDALAAEVSPIDDIRSSASYRRQVAQNLLSEFLDRLFPNEALDRWNKLETPEAEAVLRKCCGASRWVKLLTAARPFANAGLLIDAADRVWRDMREDDWLEAFRSHPRIGQSPAPHDKWAASEQAGMSQAGDAVRTKMAQLNAEFLARFGFIYIVCAMGKSGAEMLESIERRLESSRETELQEAAEQQRQIMQIRLRKWLGE